MLVGSGEVYAGGSFDVPKVNDGFNQFEQDSSPQQEQMGSTPSVEEEKGFWNSITKPLADAWDWTTEKTSAFGDWLAGVLSKITEVVVNALAATWDWILEHKIFCTVVLTILGIALVIVAVVYGTAVALVVGVGILIEETLGGIVSFLSGNGFMSEAMLEDMLIWGLSSGIAAIVFEWVAASVARAPLIASIAQKVPWLGRALPKMFGSAAAGGMGECWHKKTNKIFI